MRVIILIDYTFSERDYDRFGIDVMKKRSVDIMLWDFIELRDKKLNLHGFERDTQKIKRFIFNSYSQLESKSNELKGVFIIDHRSSVNKRYPLSWFKQKGAFLVKMRQGLLPVSVWNLSPPENIINLILRILQLGFYKTIIKAIDKIFNKNSKNNQFSYDAIIYGGKLPECDNNTLCIEAHSLDYNLFLEIGGSAKKTGYIVFLDNGMPDHPDFSLLNIKPHCSKDLYYPAMNQFFDAIESSTNIKVIISSHPRLTNLLELSKNYGGRKVVRGTTAKILRDANIVLAHNTAAISFAVLWQKPLLILTTKQLQYTNYASMKSVCALLGVNSVNVDNFDVDTDWLFEANKAKDRYHLYKKLLIKNEGTPEKNSWDIFLDTVETVKRFDHARD